MFDRSASGQDRRLGAGIAYRVHNGAKPTGLGFGAHGLNLLIRHALVSARAEARGGEELDDVGAFGFGSADQRPQRLRVPAAGVDLAQGSQNARSRQDSLINPVPHHAIDRRPDALHGGKAAFERYPCISGRIERGIFGFVASAHRLMVGVHVPVHMDVSIDPPGHHGKASQIVSGFRVSRGYGLNPRALDDDLLVPQHAAFAVEQSAGPDYDLAGRGLGQCEYCVESQEEWAEAHT